MLELPVETVYMDSMVHDYTEVHNVIQGFINHYQISFFSVLFVGCLVGFCLFWFFPFLGGGLLCLDW